MKYPLLPTARHHIYWPEHISNGGTAVTRLSAPEGDLITESVRLFGDPSIYVSENVMHSTRKRQDLSDFWAFHRKRINEPLP